MVRWIRRSRSQKPQGPSTTSRLAAIALRMFQRTSEKTVPQRATQAGNVQGERTPVRTAR